MQLNLIQLSKKNKLNINIIFFSILLIPISFFVGPAITEILIFLIFISFIYTFVNEKNLFIMKNFEIIIISFFFLIIISSLLSDFKIISLKSSLLSIRFIVLIYAIIFILNKIDYFFKFFFIICFGCLLLNILAGYLQFFIEYFYKIELFLNKDIWSNIDPKITITGFFGNEKRLGSFLCRLFPITVGLYLLVSKVKNNKKIINILIFFIPLFILVFLTSERMSLLYCTLTFFFILIYASRINRKNVIIFPLLLILTVLILYFYDLNRFKRTIDHSYNQLFPRDNLVYFSDQHQFFALTSLELFKNNPILGVGPNNYRNNCHEYSSDFIAEKYEVKNNNIQNCSTHPHNIFFQLLSETGLLGIIFYAIFNIFLLIQIIKFFFKKDYNKISFFFLLPVIYYLNPLFPSGNFFNNWYMCFGILGIPFYLYLARNKKK